MKFLKNKLLIGVLCILIGLLFSFVALPAILNGSQSAKVNAVRLKQDVQAGTQFTADMVETVTVPESAVEGGIADASSVIGRYAVTDLFAGDYLTAEKLTSTLAEQNPLLAGEGKGKTVVSVTLPSLASGVSGRLLPGDIVTVIAVPKDSVNQTLGTEPDSSTGEAGAYIDPDLEYIEVCMVTTSDGADADVSANPGKDTKNALPATVSFYATQKQALKLAELEQESSIYLSFVARGASVSDYMPDSVLAGTEAN